MNTIIQVYGILCSLLMIFHKNHWSYFLRKRIDALDTIMNFEAKREEECGRKISVF